MVLSVCATSRGAHAGTYVHPDRRVVKRIGNRSDAASRWRNCLAFAGDIIDLQAFPIRMFKHSAAFCRMRQVGEKVASTL